MGLLTGVIYFFRAILMILSKKRFLMLALIPSLVTLFISMASIKLSMSYSDELLTYLWGSKNDSMIWSILDYLLGSIGAILSLFITPWLVILIGFPLCEPLATAIDESLGGQEVDVSLFKSVIIGLKNSIGLVLLGLTGSIILMIMGLLPGLSLITVPINFFIWTPLILAFDLCDGVFVRRNLNFTQRKNKLFSHFFGSISVGFIAFLLISIPFLNLIGLPVAVCMGTLHANKICDDI